MKTGSDTLQTEFNLYTCKTCGEPFPLQVEKHFGNYGTDRDGAKHCLPCCGKNDLAEVLKSGTWIGYLTERESIQERRGCENYTRKLYSASNWPGTLKIDCPFSYQTRHNFGGKVTHVWFKLPGDPFVWYGKQIGEFNQILRAKRTKKEKF